MVHFIKKLRDVHVHYKIDRADHDGLIYFLKSIVTIPVGTKTIRRIHKILFKDRLKGFCNSTSIERVRDLDYVLTPGRYVGLPDAEDDFDFNERFSKLKAEFEGELKTEHLQNIFETDELKEISVCRDFRHTAEDGKEYTTKFYNVP